MSKMILQNKGTTQTTLHHNNHTDTSYMNWDAKHDGNNTNILLNINKNGMNTSYDIELDNQDLAKILNIDSVKIPLHKRLLQDFDNSENHFPSSKRTKTHTKTYTKTHTKKYKKHQYKHRHTNKLHRKKYNITKSSSYHDDKHNHKQYKEGGQKNIHEVDDEVKNIYEYSDKNHVYPPFKKGLYLEEYFLKKIQDERPNLKRKYIPMTWTNFQIAPWFQSKKKKIQNKLDTWIKNNPSKNGYFIVVQHADGPLLTIPENTTVYSGSSGDIPLPLIYQDSDNRLMNIPKKKFNEKSILCSFVGNITYDSRHQSKQSNVRQEMFNKLSKYKDIELINSGGWKSDVNEGLQQLFINKTVDSKFSLAPRGYGRSSFRFFECFQLGTIPIYIWDDIEWLPFKKVIDYNRLCISIHVSKIDDLHSMLLDINEEKYNNMLKYYQEIKHLFELEGMSNQIIKEMS